MAETEEEAVAGAKAPPKPAEGETDGDDAVGSDGEVDVDAGVSEGESGGVGEGKDVGEGEGESGGDAEGAGVSEGRGSTVADGEGEGIRSGGNSACAANLDARNRNHRHKRISVFLQ
jgi:hypothetical protein